MDLYCTNLSGFVRSIGEYQILVLYVCINLTESVKFKRLRGAKVLHSSKKYSQISLYPFALQIAPQTLYFEYHTCIIYLFPFNCKNSVQFGWSCCSQSLPLFFSNIRILDVPSSVHRNFEFLRTKPGSKEQEKFSLSVFLESYFWSSAISVI